MGLATFFYIDPIARDPSTIGNLKNTVHVTWRAIRGEAVVGFERELVT